MAIDQEDNIHWNAFVDALLSDHWNCTRRCAVQCLARQKVQTLTLVLALALILVLALLQHNDGILDAIRSLEILMHCKSEEAFSAHV